MGARSLKTALMSHLLRANRPPERTVANKGLYDQVGMAQVDLVGLLLVLTVAVVRFHKNQMKEGAGSLRPPTSSRSLVLLS